MDGCGVGDAERDEYPGRPIDSRPGVSFESGRELSISSSLSSSPPTIGLLRERFEVDALVRDMDLYDVPVAEDAVGAAWYEGEGVPRLAPEVTGRVRLRTLTRMDECMLIVSLLLSVSLARKSVDCLGGLCGFRWDCEAGIAGLIKSSSGTSMLSLISLSAHPSRSSNPLSWRIPSQRFPIHLSKSTRACST